MSLEFYYRGFGMTMCPFINGECQNNCEFLIDYQTDYDGRNQQCAITYIAHLLGWADQRAIEKNRESKKDEEA